MVDIRIGVTGVQRIRDVLFRLANLNVLLDRPMRDATSLLARDLAHYPPLSEANMPPLFYGRWYTRGSGLFYKSAGGEIKLLRHSERLGVSWRTSYAFRPELMRGEITTSVSYAPLVHGTRDQADFHARRGWRTVQTLFEQHRGVIVNIIGGAVRNAMLRE